MQFHNRRKIRTYKSIFFLLVIAVFLTYCSSDSPSSPPQALTKQTSITQASMKQTEPTAVPLIRKERQTAKVYCEGNKQNDGSYRALTADEQTLMNAAIIGNFQGVGNELSKKVCPNIHFPGPSYKGYTPFHWAAFKGYLEVAKNLIDADADINIQDSNGDTPLHKSAFWGNFNIVKNLIESGADLNITDNQGRTPLHDVALWGKLEAVTKLIEADAELNIQDNEDKTPLYEAAYWGQLEVIKKLIESGAKLNIKAQYGWTAMHVAANKGYTNIVEELLKAGADKTITNDAEETAEQVARKQANNKDDNSYDKRAHFKAIADYIQDYGN